MFIKVRFAYAFILIMGSLFLLPQQSRAQERLCDPSFEFCYWPLIDSVNAENVGIDMAIYMIELPGLANAIISRHQAGVAVRIIVEPRANIKFPGNQALLDQFRAAGIPMRYKLGDGILHSKMMLLAGQNKVVFSGSNFGDADVGPYEPFANYVDGAWYFSDDPAVVNSCKTRLDDIWTNTTLYGNYANINGPLTRRYPTFPIDPSMNFVPNSNPLEDYGRRAMERIDRESQKLDITMYRITDTAITDAVLRAVGRGVQVRLLAEPLEYRFNSDRFSAQVTGPYNIDRLFAAGVQIKMRKHRGLNHQKSLQLYSQGMTIFGSSNWGVESYNSEEEHNYFTTKPWFFDWFVNQFDRKWNSATEYEAFAPQPPDTPSNISPTNGASAQLTPVTLTWEGGRWAHKYDIYVGTNSNSLQLIASDVVTGPPGAAGPESYTVSGLQSGTTYLWRVVGKTMANRTATGPVWSFTTGGASPPPPPQAPTVSGISPASGTTLGGTSVTITGTNFAAGATVSIGGAGATNVSVTSGTSISATTPAHSAGAVNVVVTNSNGQSGTLTGGYTYVSPPPPPPPSASDVVLYAAEAPFKAGAWSLVSDPSAAGGSRLHNTDAGAAKVSTPLASPSSYFEMTFNAEAGRPYRLWIRGKAQNDHFGNDSVFVQFSASVNSGGAAIYRIGTTTAAEMNLEDCSGCGLSGWGWQDNGWGVGVMGPVIYFQTTGTQTVRVQPREDGLSIDQIVLSPSTYLNSSPGALKNDTTILPKSGGAQPPPPPPPPSAQEVVLYAGESAVKVGGWTAVADSSAAGGTRLHLPDVGAAKVSTPLASPAKYFEMTFNAVAGTPYRLWIRGKAQSDFYANDSVFIQFSGSVNSSGGAIYRIGTTAGTEMNLEDCSGCGLSGWGWQDNGWGVGVMGPVIYFQTTGTQTIRIQNREDGLSIDQIVLSPSTYLNSSPGALKNDNTILPR